MRGQGAGDDARIAVRLEFPVFYGKGLLEDNSVLVLRVSVSAETEISKAVYDIAAFIFFNALEDVGVMSENQGGAAANGVAAEGFLFCIWIIFALYAPVETYDDDFGVIFLCLCNAGLNLVFRDFFQCVKSQERHFDTVYRLVVYRRIAAVTDAIFPHGVLGVGEGSPAVIF